MKKIIGIICMFVAVAASAQDHVDLAKALWRYAPNAEMKNDPSRSRTLQHQGFQALVPVQLNDNNIVLIGTNTEQLIIDTKAELPTETIDTRRKYLLSNVQLGYQKKWSPKFKTTAVVVGKMISDQPKFWNDDHLQIGAVLQTAYKKSDKFTFKAGLYVNDDFFGPFVNPLLGFYWKPTEKLHVDVLMLQKANITYRANDKIWFGTGFQGGINSYGHTDEDQYLEKVDNNLFAFTEIFLQKNTVLHLRAGHSLLRTYRYYPTSERLKMKVAVAGIGDDRPEYQEDIKNGLMCEARLIFRLWLPKDNEQDN